MSIDVSTCKGYVRARYYLDGRYVHQLFVRSSAIGPCGKDASNNRNNIYKKYNIDYKNFMSDCYSVNTDELGDDFFTKKYNIDHAVPVMWLMKELGDSGDYESEGYQYVSLLLTDASINKSWGSSFEKSYYNNRARVRMGGAASFFTLCKVYGIYPPLRTGDRIETPKEFEERILGVLRNNNVDGSNYESSLCSIKINKYTLSKIGKNMKEVYSIKEDGTIDNVSLLQYAWFGGIYGFENINCASN